MWHRAYRLGGVHKLRYLFLPFRTPTPPFVILRHLLAYPLLDDEIYEQENDIMMKVGAPLLMDNFDLGAIFDAS